MPTKQVKAASQTEMDQCVALITLAFSSDPAARFQILMPSSSISRASSECSAEQHSNRGRLTTSMDLPPRCGCRQGRNRKRKH
jgi:hypothetical protein